VAEEPKSRPELEADLSGKLVAQLRKKPLRGYVLRVRVNAQYTDAAPGRDLLRLLHHGAGDSSAAKGRVNGEPMHYDGRFVDIPAHLRIVRLLVHGDRGQPGDTGVSVGDPELAQIDVALKNRFIGVGLVPLQIAHCAHQRNHPPHEVYQAGQVLTCGEPYSHNLPLLRRTAR